jgi:hypothetical protein
MQTRNRPAGAEGGFDFVPFPNLLEEGNERAETPAKLNHNTSKGEDLFDASVSTETFSLENWRTPTVPLCALWFQRIPVIRPDGAGTGTHPGDGQANTEDPKSCEAPALGRHDTIQSATHSGWKAQFERDLASHQRPRISTSRPMMPGRARSW